MGLERSGDVVPMFGVLILQGFLQPNRQIVLSNIIIAAGFVKPVFFAQKAAQDGVGKRAILPMPNLRDVVHGFVYHGVRRVLRVVKLVKRDQQIALQRFNVYRLIEHFAQHKFQAA